MLTRLQKHTRYSKPGIILQEIYKNWRTKRRLKAGKFEATTGSTHINMPLRQSLNYINQVFNDYLDYSGITIDMLRDKRILEIGPGDNLGVAIKFLLAGARQVVCLDKFFSKRDSEQQRKIYQALREGLNENERCMADEVLDPESGLRSGSQKLTYSYGTGIEEAEEIFDPESFDLIVSRAVLMCVYDPDSTFAAMHRLLQPGGYMIHKIDFRDYGMFSNHKHHPLTFLTIPSSVYRLMTHDSGNSNRRLINYYRRKACELGYDTKILITQIVGEKDEIIPHKELVRLGVDYTDANIALLNSIRPYLQPEFRDMPDEELLVSGIFLVARKP